MITTMVVINKNRVWPDSNLGSFFMKNSPQTDSSRQKKIWLGVKMIFKSDSNIEKKITPCAPFALNLSWKQQATAVAAALNFI
jgi:hypothetical protein